MSSAAEATREALRARPFLHEALRAGVLNHRAAAEVLDVDADVDTVAAALRRYADSLDEPTGRDRRVRVTVRRNVGVETGEPGDDAALLRVGETAVVDGGDATAFVATGDVDAAALAAVLARLGVGGVPVVAAALAGDGLVVVVDAGTRTLGLVEAALGSAPDWDAE